MVDRVAALKHVAKILDWDQDIVDYLAKKRIRHVHAVVNTSEETYRRLSDPVDSPFMDADVNQWQQGSLPWRIFLVWKTLRIS